VCAGESELKLNTLGGAEKGLRPKEEERGRGVLVLVGCSCSDADAEWSSGATF